VSDFGLLADGLPKTREALPFYPRGTVGRKMTDRALVEIEAAEAVIATARQIVAFARNGDDDYIPKADLAAALALLDGASE
jgi:hypothetical protein